MSAPDLKKEEKNRLKYFITELRQLCEKHKIYVYNNDVLSFYPYQDNDMLSVHKGGNDIYRLNLIKIPEIRDMTK